MGGHRRINVKSLERYAYGVGKDDAEEEGYHGIRKICIYSRVSSFGQDTRGSRTRQTARLLDEVCNREGIAKDEVVIFEETASSFGNRPILNDLLIGWIIGGRIKKIYAEYMDRLARDSIYHFIVSLCEKFNVEIVCLDTEDSEPNEILQKELLNFINVICNRVNSQKAKMVCEKNLDEKGIARLFELRNKGNKIKDCFAQLNKEGFTDSKGGPVSYGTVRKYLLLNGAANKVVNGGGLSADQIVKDFVNKFIIHSENGRISVNSIYPAYCKYCETLSVLPQVKTLFGGLLSKIFTDAKTVKSNGVRNWVGYSLN
jgi:predicted site-specific integrase-resolvase